MSSMIETMTRLFSVASKPRSLHTCRAVCCVGLGLLLGAFNSAQGGDKSPSSGYAHDALIIEANELLKAPSRPGARLILDVRTPEEFAENHLKDAVNVVPADWTKDFGDGVDADRWARRFGELGIGRDTEVVLYDDRAGQDAARIWWYLRYWGVCQARVVNGGWKSLQAEKGLSFVAGSSRIPAVASFSSPPVAARRVDLKSVVAAVNSNQSGKAEAGDLQLVDTRTDKEYRGQQAAEGVRPGTIPGARHLEWADLVDASTDRFRTSDQVRKILRERGIELDRPIAVFSNTRGRSSAISLPLELAGATQIRVFDAGYKAWAADATNPVTIAP